MQDAFLELLNRDVQVPPNNTGEYCCFACSSELGGETPFLQTAHALLSYKESQVIFKKKIFKGH